MTQPRSPKVVVIGAGFGGLIASKSLGSNGLRVTLIDKTNHHVFQPLLYQVATAGLSPAEIAVPIRSIVRGHPQTEVILDEVTGIDREQQTVRLKSGNLVGYDFLVIATGATHSYFGQDGWQHFAPGLKTLEDASIIRRDILLAFEKAEVEPDPERRRSLLNFVIVGGGPTGVELAGALAELSRRVLARDFRHIDPKSARIILVEAGERLLNTFPRKLSAQAQRDLERLGVDVRCSSRVESVTGQGVQIGSDFVPAETVIWAAGVQSSPVGKWLGVETGPGGRVPVRPDLTLENHPEIFVIGDCALAMSEKGTALPGVAPVAMQQGRYVAQVMLRRIRGGRDPGPFRYRNKGNLATIGRSSAIADFGFLQLGGFAAWGLWLLIHILYLIGFRNRVLVLIQWAWAYLTFQRGSRLITLTDYRKTG